MHGLKLLRVGGVVAGLSLIVTACGGPIIIPPTADSAAGQPDAGGAETCDYGHDDQCDDDDSCTVDSCLATGVCEHTAKTDVCKIDGACVDPGTLATSSQCQICDPARAKDDWSPVQCDDENPCTRDLCDPAQGCTAIPDNSLACDDGQDCSTDDHCEDGQCVASPCGCTDAATDCDDGLDCTDDTCDASTGACGHTVAAGTCLFDGVCFAQGETCDDANPCTEGDTCQDGACVGTDKDCGAPSTCHVMGCDAATGACAESEATAGAPCDDGDPCTEGDVCAAGAACAGTAKDCSALADACHTAKCEAGACVASPAGGGPCDDGSDCTLDDTCTADGACVGTWDDVNCGCDDDGPCAALDGPCTTGTCDTALHQCVAQPKDGTCDDGDPCTSGDACASGQCTGAAHPCVPALPCMTSTCDGAGGCTEGVMANFCAMDGACYQDGMANPANPCQVCDASQSTTAWTNAADATPCNADSNGCTDGDACQGGVCLAGAQVSCDDGKSCTTDTCTSAGPDAHTCSHPINAGSCLIGGGCYADGALSGDKCDSCVAAQSPTAWTPRASGTVCASPDCQDNSTCDGSGTCVAHNGSHDGEVCGGKTGGVCANADCWFCCDPSSIGPNHFSTLCLKGETVVTLDNCPAFCCGTAVHPCFADPSWSSSVCGPKETTCDITDCL